jgi:hypothetical protein
VERIEIADSGRIEYCDFAVEHDGIDPKCEH